MKKLLATLALVCALSVSTPAGDVPIGGVVCPPNTTCPQGVAPVDEPFMIDFVSFILSLL